MWLPIKIKDTYEINTSYSWKQLYQQSFLYGNKIFKRNYASTILATNTNVSFHICVFIYKNNESYKIFQLGNYHLISTHKFH